MATHLWNRSGLLLTLALVPWLGCGSTESDPVDLGGSTVGSTGIAGTHGGGPAAGAGGHGGGTIPAPAGATGSSAPTVTGTSGSIGSSPNRGGAGNSGAGAGGA